MKKSTTIKTLIAGCMMFLLSMSNQSFGFGWGYPRNGDQLNLGVNYRLEWDDFNNDTDRFEVEIKYNGETKIFYIDSRGLDGQRPPSYMDYTFPCNDLINVGSALITVKAYDKYAFKSGYRLQDGGVAAVTVVIIPKNLPVFPKLYVQCYSPTQTYCFPSSYHVGLDPVSFQPIRSSETREFYYYTNYIQSVDGDINDKESYIGENSLNPGAPSICFTPKNNNTSFQTYYVKVVDRTCSNGAPNITILTLLILPKLEINTSATNGTAFIADDSYLPEANRCFLPGSFFPLNKNVVTLALPVGTTISQEVDWFHIDEINPNVFDKKFMSPDESKVCYSNIYPRDFREYLCKVKITFFTFDSNTGTTKPTFCEVETKVKVSILNTNTPATTSSTVCPSNVPTQFNTGYCGTELLYDYIWTPGTALSSTTDPCPNIEYSKMNAGNTKYTLRRTLKTAGGVAEIVGYYNIKKGDGSEASCRATCNYNVACNDTELQLNKTEPVRLDQFDYRWEPATALSNAAVPNPVVSYAQLPAGTTYYVYSKKAKTEAFFDTRHIQACYYVKKAASNSAECPMVAQTNTPGMKLGGLNDNEPNDELLNQVFDFKIYPNPNDGNFNIDYKTDDINATVTIIDVTGKVIRIEKLDQTKNYIQINLESIPNGVYFVKYSNQKDTITKRIVKL